MCRSIKRLHQAERVATDGEVQAAALQFVRKISGSRTPSRANTAVFDLAVEEIAAAARRLLDTLEAPRRRVTRISPPGEQPPAT